MASNTDEAPSPAVADAQTKSAATSTGLWTGMALIGGSCVFALVLGEIFLAAAPQFQLSELQERVFCAGAPVFSQSSPAFARTEVPDSIFYERQHEAEGWRLHINNRMGFRDMFDSGDPKILLFGDSMTRGSLVNNSELYPDLLDSWTPQTGVRAFGIGGWGTGDELRAYRAVAPTTPHSLVILGYFVGNDLTDNIKTGFSLVNGKAVEQPADVQRQHSAAPSLRVRVLSFLARNLRTVRFMQGAYNLLFVQNRHYFERSETEIADLFKLGTALLDDLATEARSNGANLLVVIIPDFNESRSEGAARGADAQRDMLKALAARHVGVFALDLRKTLAAYPLDQVYGRHDRHLTRFGQYLVAREIAGWLHVDAPDFDPAADIEIVPDCSRVGDYAAKLGAYGPGS